MNKTLITFFTVLFCLTSSVGWSEVMDDLVKRDGLYYKKYTDVPFNGKITGKEFQGLIKNGEKEGLWRSYLSSGNLSSKGIYKNGKMFGSWVWYWDNGQVYAIRKFNVHGQSHGTIAQEFFHQNGQLMSRKDFKNGLEHGFGIGYYDNGNLAYKCNYKNGKREGSCISYDKNGSIEKTSGIYKDDKKISD